MSADLAQKALAVMEALATMAADGQQVTIAAPDGQQVTIAQDWGFGSATLINAQGGHTHVGNDWAETREENLALFVEGMHALLVEGRGLSWASPTASLPVEGE